LVLAISCQFQFYWPLTTDHWPLLSAWSTGSRGGRPGGRTSSAL
jgi:hypothetical protein